MATPRVLVLGDSLLLAFRARLATRVGDEGLEVVGPGSTCGDAASLGQGIEAWAGDFAPDIAAFGCGPWAMEMLVEAVAVGEQWAERLEPLPLSTFEHALMETVRVLTRFCGRQVVYWTTPPIHERRIGSVTGDRDAGHRINAWIARYNQIATGLMGELNVSMADLHHEVARFDEDALGPDGADLSPMGIELAARVVASGVFGVIHP